MVPLIHFILLVLAKTNDPNIAHIPGFVQKYILVTTILNIEGEKRNYKLYLALVHWLSRHEYQYWFHYPVEVWRVYSHFVGLSSFSPVCNIMCRCSHVTDTIRFLKNQLQLLYHSIYFQVFEHFILRMRIYITRTPFSC